MIYYCFKILIYYWLDYQYVQMNQSDFHKQLLFELHGQHRLHLHKLKQTRKPKIHHPWMRNMSNPLLCLSTTDWRDINQLTCPPGDGTFCYHIWLPCKTKGICIGVKTCRVPWIYPCIQCNLLCVSQVRAGSFYHMQLQPERAHRQV